MKNSEGVILFSLGVSLDSKAAPKQILRSFLKAFGKTQYRILFQFNGDKSALKIPKNVKVVGWVSQDQILGKLSVTIK